MELEQLKNLNTLAIADDKEAQKLMLEFVYCDLTDFGSRDMIACKIATYLKEMQNGKIDPEGTSGEDCRLSNKIT